MNWSLFVVRKSDDHQKYVAEKQEINYFENERKWALQESDYKLFSMRQWRQ